MPPGGVKPRPPKRVHADLPTNPRVTRSKKALLQDADAGTQSEEMSDPKHQTPSVIHKPTASMACVRPAEEIVPNFDDHGVEGKFLTIIIISCSYFFFWITSLGY